MKSVYRFGVIPSLKFNGLRLVLFTNLDKIFKNVKHRVFKLMLSLIAGVGKEKLRTFNETKTQTFFRSGTGSRSSEHERSCPKPEHAHATTTNVHAGHDPPPNV